MKVARQHDRLAASGATAVFVTHDRPEVLRRTMLRDVESPFPVLVDVARQTYDGWGLARASFARVWLDPLVWGRYARLVAAGERIRGLGRDTRQLGGDFVVGPDGTVIYARAQRRDDRPPVGTLVRAIEAESGFGGSATVSD